MKDTLEFTAAFIIAAKVSGDVGTIVARRNSPAEANSRDKTLENLSRPKRTEMKQASLPLLWFSCALLKPESWLYTEGLVTAFWSEYDPFAIYKGTFDSPRDYCKIILSVHCFDGWCTRSMSTALGELQCTFTFPNAHQCVIQRL